MSGLQLQRRAGATVVRCVIAGSPADSAGVRVDDELVTIDDVPVSAAAPLPLPELQLPGSARRLTFRRGGETRSVVLALRPLI